MPELVLEIAAESEVAAVGSVVLSDDRMRCGRRRRIRLVLLCVLMDPGMAAVLLRLSMMSLRVIAGFSPDTI